MAENIQMNIQGLAEIQQALKQLPDDITEKILQDVMLKAGAIVKNEIQEAAPEGVNDKLHKTKLKQGVVVTKSQNGGALVGFKKWQGFIAMLNEKGTSVRKTLGRGKYSAGANRGSMPRKPFVLDAHQRAIPKAIDFFSTNFGKLVNNAVKKRLNKFIKSSIDYDN